MKTTTRIHWTVGKAFSLLCGTVVLASCLGCQTKAPSSKLPPDAVVPKNVSPIGEASMQQRQRLKSAIGPVLHEHHFPPATILEATGSNIFAISARPKSNREVEMIVVKMSSSGQINVRIVGYAYVGSDWIVLGRLFQESSARETIDMERKIHQKLGKTF